MSKNQFGGRLATIARTDNFVTGWIDRTPASTVEAVAKRVIEEFMATEFRPQVDYKSIGTYSSTLIMTQGVGSAGGTWYTRLVRDGDNVLMFRMRIRRDMYKKYEGYYRPLLDKMARAFERLEAK